MPASPVLVSPKQAARAMGVSESSLKRWCDRGWMTAIRTAGGHRKVALGEVLRFAREHDRPLASPELVVLPPPTRLAAAGLERKPPRLAAALLAGDELLARQIVLELYLAGHTLSAIGDELIACAFREIGQRWSCGEVDVYQERRGCEIILKILCELRRLQPSPKPALVAVGGTIAGDIYALGTCLAELVLLGAGFSATSLGTSIPVASCCTAVRQLRPTIFWLSVSHLTSPDDFVSQFASLSNCCAETGTALVVGGRALTEDLRRQMTYTAFCDTLKHLETFSRSLSRAKLGPRSVVRSASARPRGPRS